MCVCCINQKTAYEFFFFMLRKEKYIKYSVLCSVMYISGRSMCVVCGVWCVLCSVWCVVCCVWCVVCGVWCVVCGVWCVVRGLWCVVCGVCCVVCGVWCVLCGCVCVCVWVCVCVSSHRRVDRRRLVVRFCYRYLRWYT